MGKRCSCSEKKEKNCCLDVKIDFTKIVKRICFTVMVIFAIKYLPGALKEYFLENDK